MARIKGSVDGTPTATTPESQPLLIAFQTPFSLTDIDFVNDGTAVTANDSDYASLTITRRDNTGASVATYTMTTKTSGSGASGNIGANAQIKYSSLIAATFPVTCSAGDYFTFLIAKAGNGVTTGKHTVFLIFTM